VTLLGLAATAAVVTASAFGGADIEVEGGVIGGGWRDVVLLTLHPHFTSDKRENE